MFCQKCGNQIKQGAKFCNKCGLEVKTDLSKNNSVKSVNNILANQYSVEAKGPDTIKCGNCGYIGPGEPARSLTGKILAWICIIISWPITVIYFLATHKYRCPKCKSTFLGVKNKDGIFVGQRGGAGKWVFIILVIIIAVAIIAILAAIVLVNVTSYINKGKDAAIKADMATIITNAAVYQYANNTYDGFTDSNQYTQYVLEIQKSNGDTNVVENTNSSNGHFCICSNLESITGDTYCEDDSGYSKETSTNCSTRCDYLGLCND